MYFAPQKKALMYSFISDYLNYDSFCLPVPESKVDGV